VGVKGLIFLDPKNKVLAEVLRQRFDDPRGKDFESQIVADFDGAGFPHPRPTAHPPTPVSHTRALHTIPALQGVW
jgi:hypothetical protein